MNTRHLTFGALLAASVFIAMPKAHAATSGSFSNFMARVTGKSGSVGIGAGGTPIATTPTKELVAGGGWAQAGNFGVAGGATAADGFVLGGNGSMTLGGKSVTFAGKAQLAKDSVIGAAMGCLTGGAVGCVLGAASPFVLDWLANAGVRKNPDTGALERQDAQVIGEVFVNGANQGEKSYRDACDAYAGGRSPQTMGYPAGYTFSSTRVVTLPDGDNICRVDVNNAGGRLYDSVDFPMLMQQTGTKRVWIPASMDDIAPYMRKTAVAPGVVDELVKAGAPVQQGTSEDMANTAKYKDGVLLVSPWEVTGPASVTSSPTTTTTSDGKKVTSQDTTSWTYDGSTVTQGPTRTTTATTNPDGTTTTTTTTQEPTTGTDTGSGKEDEGTPADTPLPDLPKLYEPKYPQGLEGVWQEQKERLKATSLSQLTSSLMPNVGSGGSCPSWQINLEFASWASFGSHDVAPPCQVWDWGRMIILVSALLLARSLIFGG